MLLTDWKKVGVAGPTIDGREIDPEWLRSMAKSYSLDTYTASLNEDHFLPGGLGTVHDLKTGKDERGRLALFARINPKAGLLSRVQNGFNVFFSMEIRHNFPQEGEHYLSGLAVTDEPASLGLQPTQFSTTGAELFKQAIPARLEKEDLCEIEDRENLTAQPEQPAEPETAAEAEALPGLLKNFLEQIKSLLKGGAGAEPTAETDPMTAEEIKRLEALETSLAEIKELLTAQAPASPGAEDPEGKDAEDKGTEAAGDQGASEDVSAALAEIKQGQEALSARLDKHDEFMGQTNETESLDVTAGEDGQMPGVW